MSRRILVTGGAGFIGANFVNHWIEKHPDDQLINLDKLTYAAAPENITANGQENYRLIEGDIADPLVVRDLFGKYEFDGVIHFAAESHVDNSITSPGEFMNTNIMGTFYLLQAAYNQWMDGPHSFKTDCGHKRFHHISTDEVYGSLGDEGFFEESTAYAPNSPYSASKASSDMIVRSYHHTFGLNQVMTNCSNNYGPFQHSEKLIPVIIRNAISGNPIPIYGDGKNIRDWLFVEDHCRAIEEVFLNGRSGETYNVGGETEKTNIDLARKICSLLDGLKPRKDGKPYEDQIEFVKDRPGHDWRYAVSIKKINAELSWAPSVTLEQGLVKTIQWYLEKWA